MLQARLSEGIAAVVALFDAPKAQTRQLLLVLLNHFHQVLFNIVPSNLVLRFVALFWWFSRDTVSRVSSVSSTDGIPS